MLYSVKLVNSERKSEYSVEKWYCRGFDSVVDLEKNLKKRFEKLQGEISFGYFQPGHGLKRRQHWINNDDDLTEMYKLYEGKKEILIWCYNNSKPHKRKSDNTHTCDQSRSSKCERNEQALEDVKGIVENLQEKHQNQFTQEQYNAWAQLINVGKHHSLDEPPNYPFFKARRKKVLIFNKIHITHLLKEYIHVLSC